MAVHGPKVTYTESPTRGVKLVHFTFDSESHARAFLQDRHDEGYAEGKAKGMEEFQSRVKLLVNDLFGQTIFPKG